MVRALANAREADRPRRRGILFTAPMSLAVRVGKKTSTRRVIPNVAGSIATVRGVAYNLNLEEDRAAYIRSHAAYPVRDTLWIREAFAFPVCEDPYPPRDVIPESDWKVVYLADGEKPDTHGRDRPGMFMPEWTSRTEMVVEAVTIQRLSEMGYRDYLAEGIVEESFHVDDGWPQMIGYFVFGEGLSEKYTVEPREAFWRLWNRLHGAGAAEADPWVLAYSFRLKFAR